MGSAPSPADLSKRAAKALGEGRPVQARRLAERALGLDPNEPAATIILGVLARERGDSDLAERLLRGAVQRRPRDAEAIYQLALTLHQRPAARDEARGLYERACALMPKAALPHAMLAKLFEESNEVEAARQACDRALALQPTHPTARLVRTLLDRREGKLAEARAGFIELIYGEDGATMRGFGAVSQAAIWNRYAKTLDALGEHDAAFDAFTYAHTVLGSVQRVNPQVPLQLIASAKAVMTAERLGEWAAFDPADGLADPVFIVGFPRSGTTLTEQILAAHPGVATLDEDSPLSDLMGPVAALSPQAPYTTGVPLLSEEKVRELRAAYWAGARRRLGEPLGPRVLVDKLPLTILHLPLVCRVFPRARIVVALRDPRDVCVSGFMQVMTPNHAMWHLRSIPAAARFYAAVMGYWLEVRPRMVTPWMEWKYEDLIADPEGRARALLEFLGVAWDAGVLGFYERSRGKAITTPSYEAVSRPINDLAVGRWRPYAQRFEGTLETLAPLMEQLGYAQEAAP